MLSPFGCICPRRERRREQHQSATAIEKVEKSLDRSPDREGREREGTNFGKEVNVASSQREISGIYPSPSEKEREHMIWSASLSPQLRPANLTNPIRHNTHAQSKRQCPAWEKMCSLSPGPTEQQHDCC